MKLVLSVLPALIFDSQAERFGNDPASDIPWARHSRQRLVPAISGSTSLWDSPSMGIVQYKATTVSSAWPLSRSNASLTSADQIMTAATPYEFTTHSHDIYSSHTSGVILTVSDSALYGNKTKTTIRPQSTQASRFPVLFWNDNGQYTSVSATPGLGSPAAVTSMMSTVTSTTTYSVHRSSYRATSTAGFVPLTNGATRVFEIHSAIMLLFVFIMANRL